MHKQNIYTKPYSTTHPIGLALNYPPNNIKLDTFVNTTNSPSHILPFKMCCMLNQAVFQLGSWTIQDDYTFATEFPAQRKSRNYSQKSTVVTPNNHPKPVKGDQPSNDVCIHIYIYTNIIYTFPYQYKCFQKSFAPMLCMQCVACIGWSQDLSTKSILYTYIGIVPRKTVVLGYFNLMQTQ